MKGKVIIFESTPSEQEIKIVQGIANDKVVKELTSDLKLSNRTIEGKIYYLKKRYSIKTLGGLVALFYRHKLIK